LLTGATPSGTITFFDGATQIPGTVSYSHRAGGTDGLDASEAGDLPVTFTTSGPHVITAKYGGNADYAPSTSPGYTWQVLWHTTLALTPTVNTVDYGQPVQVTATATTPGKTPVITGTFSPPATGPDAGKSYQGTVSVDANGNQTLSATFMENSSDVGVIYSGDANYAGGSVAGQVNINLPDFSMTPSSGVLVVNANQQTATTTITLTPTNSIASTVSLQCGGPYLFNTSCTVTPASVPVNGQPVNVTVTLVADGSGNTSQIAPRAKAKRKSLVSLWWHRDWWSSAWAMMALVMIGMALWPGVRKPRLKRAAIVLSSLLLIAIGCGGGGSSGTGGGSLGGTPAPVDSTVTMTLANSKTTPNTQVNATATVTSSKTPTGQVEFLAPNYIGVLTSPAPLINGSVTSQLPLLATGIYEVYAEYTGDAFTKSAKSPMVPLTVTGDGTISISATNGPISRSTSVNVQIR
jgi:hypothetical protein